MAPRPTLPLAFFALALAGCGALPTSLTQKAGLKVAMVGAFEAPPDATGNSDPRFVKLTLNAVTLIKADGTEVEAYDGDPLDLRIINRPQIVAEQDLTDDVDAEFSSIRVTLDPEVTAGGKFEDDMTATLPTAAPTYAGTFTVEKAKSLRLNVKVQWKNTITRDQSEKTETFSAPSFSLDLDTD